MTTSSHSYRGHACTRGASTHIKGCMNVTRAFSERGVISLYNVIVGFLWGGGGRVQVFPESWRDLTLLHQHCTCNNTSRFSVGFATRWRECGRDEDAECLHVCHDFCLFICVSFSCDTRELGLRRWHFRMLLNVLELGRILAVLLSDQILRLYWGSFVVWVLLLLLVSVWRAPHICIEKSLLEGFPLGSNEQSKLWEDRNVICLLSNTTDVIIVLKGEKGTFSFISSGL